jgi:cyanophycin synthetase
VVVCVDKHPTVMAELENWSNQAQAGSGSSDGPVGDPDFNPLPTEPEA